VDGPAGEKETTEEEEGENHVYSLVGVVGVLLPVL
jgi:hypothetical protein